MIFEEGRETGNIFYVPSCAASNRHVCSHRMIQRVCERSTTGRAGSTMNELAPRGHLRPLGGRENPRRARPESRSPRRCAHAWQRCLLSAGRPEGIDQGTHDRHARARPHPQLHMRKGVNRNPSRRPELADSDSNSQSVKMTQNWALLTPPLSRAAGPAPSRCRLRNNWPLFRAKTAENKSSNGSRRAVLSWLTVTCIPTPA